MKLLRRFFVRLTNFSARRRANQRLLEELAEHLALQTEENLRAGMAPAEARRQAALKLGAAQAIREQHNAEHGLPLAENLLLDVRYAFRMLLRAPGFSLIVIATMALGVGATTAIYSVIDATLLHPLPYPSPSELVRIEASFSGAGAHDIGFSIPELRDLQNSGIFQYVSFDFHGSENVTGGSQPTHINGATVSPSYLSVLGVNATLGRTFDPHDASLGSNGEVVISDGLWKRAFGADPHIVDRSLRLDNDLFHIVGVMPASFRDQGQTSEERNTELWAADGFQDAHQPAPLRSARLSYETVARLQRGISAETAQARLATLVASLKKQYPGDYPPQDAWTVQLIPLATSLVGNVRDLLVLLFCAVGMVLLISCVNVANLLLARASARGREMAVRQAMGAARMRLVRQLFTESLLLFLLGGGTGFALLFFARKSLLRFVPESLPRIHEISLSWGVLAFAIVVSVTAGAIFGLAPAFLTSRLDLNTTLRQEGRGSNGSRQRSRFRNTLVIGELALSLVLLVAAGLLLRSFWNLFTVQPGFNPSQITAIETTLPNPNDPNTDIYHTATQESVFLREVLRRISALPGVEEAAVSDRAALPLGHGPLDLRQRPLIREGRIVQGGQPPVIDTAIVSPDYFHVLSMTLLRGRLFVEQDLETTPSVAVINEAAARAYWPGQDPIGQRVSVTARFAKPGWTEIIGVIADARTESLANSGTPQMYFDIYQRPTKFLELYVRGQINPATIYSQARTQVQAVDPEIPVFHTVTLDEVLSSSLSVRRFSMEMVALFAAAAMLLAGLGIYGTISYLVNEKSREIAIRLALGAQRSNILKMVLRQALTVAAIGAGVGLLGTFVVSHFMASQLYGVSPYDLSIVGGVTVVLTGVAVAASYVPALRAMRVDPITTLNSG